MNFLFGVEKYLYATSIVIPCSLSARKPSVNSAKSNSPSSLFFVCFSIASNWSIIIDLLSYNNLPINVLFPSSTLPAVINLSMSILSNLFNKNYYQQAFQGIQKKHSFKNSHSFYDLPWLLRSLYHQFLFHPFHLFL